jgi:hypothetical protein
VRGQKIGNGSGDEILSNAPEIRSSRARDDILLPCCSFSC